MFSIYLRAWRIFNRRDHLGLLLLLASTAVCAALEVVGIGMLVPVLALVQKPEAVLDQPVLHRIYDYANCGTPQRFLAMVCLVLLGVFLFKNAFQAFTVWAQTRFVIFRYVRKAQQLFRYYLRSPYTFHLQHNTARLLRNTQLVQPAIGNVVLPMLVVSTESLVVLSILGLLLWRDPATAALALFVLGGVVAATYALVRKRLGELGRVQTRELGQLIQQVQQSLGSIKETTVLCREAAFENKYFTHLLPLGRAQATSTFLSALPRFVNEGAAVAMVLGLLATALLLGKSSSDVFLTLGLFAVASVRLMPSLTRIAGSLASIRFYSANLNEIYSDLLASKDISLHAPAEETTRTPLEKEIRFEAVTFSYQNAKTPALSALSLRIGALQSVAFVGPSGAGKTTAVDLLLGIYPPSSGTVFVDGADTARATRSWQRNIGYVPQQIYLSDATIRQNVAFGLPDAQIDDSAVRRALRMAQLEDYVLALPEGLDTPVGERGVRLSGGQRQRIGIARALYHDPDVLVLDEATAALDNETEAAFMQSIRSLAGKKTMILIAHRLTTVEHCDQIFFMKAGCLVARGSFQELVSTHEEFRKFALPGGEAVAQAG